jgi:hypothetical protein
MAERHSQRTGERTYRPRLAVRFTWVVLVIVALFEVALVVGEVLDPVSPDHYLAMGLFFVGPLILARVVWHFSATSVVVTEGEVIIKNPGKVITVPRADCAAVELLPPTRGAFGPPQWVWLRTQSGERIKVWAWSDGWRWQMKAKVAQLNLDVLRRNAEPSTDPFG